MRRQRRMPGKPISPVISSYASDTMCQQLGWYMGNCVRSEVASRIRGVLLERLDRLKDGNGEEEPDDWCSPEDGPAQTRDRLDRKMMRELHAVLKDYEDLPKSDESLERNALFARHEFGLDELDTEILLLVLRYERNSALENLADELLSRLQNPALTVAALTGMSAREARQRIAPNGTLIESGLLCHSGDGSSTGLAGQCGYLQMVAPLRQVMHNHYRTRREWAAALVGEPLATPLAWADYEHLGPVRDLAANVLAGAAETGAKGINLLLHGPVGTGKTEFAKVVAARTGMKVWSVGEADDKGGEPNRSERLASLRLTQRLLGKRGRALILFDEAEDVLASSSPFFEFSSRFRDGSKVFINRMLEKNPVPVIWTCNEVAFVDPAVLRRMTLAVEVKTPNQPVRARIWRQVLAEADVSLDADAVRRLSGRYAAPPALAASAVRAAALAGGGEREIEQALDGVLQILGIGLDAQHTDVRDFDPELVNCREDLGALVERLCRPCGPLQWSLCLHGAPGTGKSQFAQYLAGRLGMDVMHRRASDLLSMYVGASERAIAAAFREARAQRQILLIDEADSFLADRRDAVRSWEVTQVNEMLTWMESHPLPFICTTNLMDRLDQASLRRFTLKLRFDPLTGAQSALAFEQFFGVSAPRPLPDGLSPGDFATVRRKRDLFGAPSPDLLADWLDEEAEVKGARTAAIGFAVGRP